MELTGPLYRARGPVTLVGGGPVDADKLSSALALAPEAVGADGGGDIALPGGRDFAAVIGDLDSLRGAADLIARSVPVHRVDEQDTTDLEKCLRLVEAPLFLGLGFLGGRIDHHLAAMNALVKFPDKPVVLVGDEDICFLCPPELDLDLEAGVRVSLFPMARTRGLRSEGLRWSVAGLDMAPNGQIGTSNVATGGRLRLAFDAPAMLVILPVAEMGAALKRIGG